MNQLFSLSVEAWKAALEECIDICWYTDYNAHDQPESRFDKKTSDIEYIVQHEQKLLF